MPQSVVHDLNAVVTHIFFSESANFSDNLRCTFRGVLINVVLFLTVAEDLV
jgi:hypothetical protein